MWYKLKDKEPPNQNNEYFIRNIVAPNFCQKYTGWWDNQEKEFYTFIGIESGNVKSNFEKDQYPNIEWWDEEEPNQQELWEEMTADMHEDNLPAGHIESLILFWKNKYTLTRKQTTI